MMMWRQVQLVLIVLVVSALYFLVSASAGFCNLAKTVFNFVLSERKLNNLTQNSSLIFIGGVPRSGTTLMRAMLDAHPSVRCGEETIIIPRILERRLEWKSNDREWIRLKLAGVTEEVLDDAISSFLLQVIAGHGKPAERLCNKDPYTMKSAEYLSRLYPNSKFIFMVRDGRATVYSILTRDIYITGCLGVSPRPCLLEWNRIIANMYEQCKAVSGDRCLMIHYEQLVLHPEQQMRRILSFLNIPWDYSVLHHEQFIGKEISLSKVEGSTSQVIKPVNVDALNKWVGFFSEDIVLEMASIAPMLAKLGYDPHANPPKYGEPDPIVLKNTEELHKNMEEWERKEKEVVGTLAPGKMLLFSA